MKDNCYQAVFNENLRTVFNNYVQSLEIPYIDYFAIGYQDTLNQQSFSLMSNLEWQQHFKREGFAAYDPVRKAAFGNSRGFFAFDQIDYCDSFGKEIMHQRKRYDIANGLVLMNRHLDHNFMLTLGTGYSKFDALDFYLKHAKSVRHIFNDLEQIIKPHIEDYL